MKAKVNGTELYYEVTGKEVAPWLVLSHSLACTVRMWDPQVAAFKDRYRILNYDMRGHGQSAAPQGPYTLDMLADDVLGLMKELKIERATYMGLSIGGMLQRRRRSPRVPQPARLGPHRSFSTRGRSSLRCRSSSSSGRTRRMSWGRTSMPGVPWSRPPSSCARQPLPGGRRGGKRRSFPG